MIQVSAFDSMQFTGLYQRITGEHKNALIRLIGEFDRLVF